MTRHDALVSAAQSEDLQNLLEHIAWTDVVLPRLQRLKDQYSKALVAHLLGQPLPQNLTKEQVAGKIYGIDQIIALFNQILTQGEKAVLNLQTGDNWDLT